MEKVIKSYLNSVRVTYNKDAIIGTPLILQLYWLLVELREIDGEDVTKHLEELMLIGRED